MTGSGPDTGWPGDPHVHSLPWPGQSQCWGREAGSQVDPFAPVGGSDSRLGVATMYRRPLQVPRPRPVSYLGNFYWLFSTQPLGWPLYLSEVPFAQADPASSPSASALPPLSSHAATHLHLQFILEETERGSHFPRVTQLGRGQGRELFFASTEETGWRLGGGVEATSFTPISLN